MRKNDYFHPVCENADKSVTIEGVGFKTADGTGATIRYEFHVPANATPNVATRAAWMSQQRLSLGERIDPFFNNLFWLVDNGVSITTVRTERNGEEKRSPLESNGLGFCYGSL